MLIMNGLVTLNITKVVYHVDMYGAGIVYQSSWKGEDSVHVLIIAFMIE